jgi:hypothetical protein
VTAGPAADPGTTVAPAIDRGLMVAPAHASIFSALCLITARMIVAAMIRRFSANALKARQFLIYESSSKEPERSKSECRCRNR